MKLFFKINTTEAEMLEKCHLKFRSRRDLLMFAQAWHLTIVYENERFIEFAHVDGAPFIALWRLQDSLPFTWLWEFKRDFAPKKG